MAKRVKKKAKRRKPPGTGPNDLVVPAGVVAYVTPGTVLDYAVLRLGGRIIFDSPPQMKGLEA